VRLGSQPQEGQLLRRPASSDRLTTRRETVDRTNEDRVKRQLVKRLEKLGYTVTLDKKEAA
jgi:hypothetical protein